MPLSASTQRVEQALREKGLQCQIVEFDQSTRTAQEAANAVNCEVARIVKSLLFVAAEQAVMCLVSGANQLDERKLADLLGVSRKQVQRATAEITRQATGFAIGGVCPFGLANPLPIFLDNDLQAFESVWVAAGAPNAVFEIATVALCSATQAQVVELAKRAQHE
jgi:Cys-tRNA(Pro) deacylase